MLKHQAQFYDHNNLFQANLTNMQAMSLKGSTSSISPRPSWSLQDFVLQDSQKTTTPNSSSTKGKKES